MFENLGDTSVESSSFRYSGAPSQSPENAAVTGTSRRVGVRGGILALLGIVAIATIPACQSPESPEPPSGGERYILSYERFVQDVQPVLTSQGCNAVGDCHGGGIRGTLALSPPKEPDPQFDFEQVRLQVFPYEIESSPILLKPLAESAGGSPHSFEPFASVDDPGYLTIRSWIEEGTFE